MKANKNEYHQSNLKHYFKCPAMFDFSMRIEPEIKAPTLNLFREGQLFEGYIFGFKEDKDETELIGRKKPDTISAIKKQGEYVKPMFKNVENSYVKLKYKSKDYTLAGEADNIGHLDWDYIRKYTGEKMNDLDESINDLKKTGDIKFVWSGLQRKRDSIQAIMYVYIHYKITGNILPFVFIVVEDTYKRPIIKIKKVFIQESDFEWLETFIDKVHNDLFYQQCPSFESCEGGRGVGRCWWLQWCDEGRKYIGRQELVQFALLED